MVNFKKILVCLAGLAGLFFADPAAVATGQAPLSVESEAAFLMEPVTGTVLYRKNPNRKLHPASVTKLMVMLLALEALDRGEIKLTDVVTASPEACRMGGSQIWLEPGEQMTVAELLKAVCIVSANDASYALAEHIAGSEANFIALMNQRAKQLGLRNTVYVNTTGLEPDGGGTGNLTTAADMAVLARKVVQYPLVFRWSGVWIDSLRGGKSFLRNTNKLVRFYRGCDGLKTGFTGAAGYCLVATAKREGVRLIAVVMKAPTSDDRSRDISTLFNYGFSKFKAESIYRGGEILGQIRVFRGREKSVPVKVSQELAAVIKRDAKGKIHKVVRLEKVLQAPVVSGQKIGEAVITYQGKPCGRVDLVAAREVKRATVFEIWKEIFHNIIRVGV
ncbi:MAG TPA: D-alanyl-D-alanine carboxypeptidase family protein, partial [Bacillota bacterium]